MSKVTGVIAIDDGGYSTCVVTADKAESFYSVKGPCGERRLTGNLGPGDFMVEYKGEKYVVGLTAKYDCATPLEMHSQTKSDLFYDLSVLTAIHQYGYAANYVVTPVPIISYTPEEKEARIKRLEGSHTITVNGVRKTFTINQMSVAPEAAVAFWLHQPQGISRYIDLGSRTIGYASTLNEGGSPRFLDTQSGCWYGKGIEALAEKYQPKDLAAFICGRLLKLWQPQDKVQLLGGGALDEDLVAGIRHYFPNAVVMNQPNMVNALAMYRLGVLHYGMA